MTEPAVLTNGTAQRRVEQLGKEIETALNRLEQDMLSGHSQTFLEALKFWSQFHRYSFNNSILIMLQAPYTLQVAGYRAWQALGWQVKLGAKACFIRAPWLKRLPDPETGEIEPRLVGYFPTAVFPIELTVEWEEGKRPPEPMIPATGDEWEHVYICWTRRLETIYGIQIKEQHLGNAYGMASPSSIRINERLSFTHKATTLIHEAAHIFAGHHQAEGKTLQQRELEVEATTYVLCAQLGQEHKGAVDYLLNYQIEPDQLKANLDVIGKLVKEVRAALSVGFEEQVETVEAVAA